MSILKTRQKLVDIARQLFAKKGIEGTTMNDIAVASGKGRRTLYTYFKSKEDVYYAVIESELERLSDKLDEVAAKKTSPQDKIIELIYTHLSMIKETVVRNGNLRAEFFRNIWMVEKVRKKFDEDEIELFRKVRRAVTDSEADIRFDPVNKPGVSNLLSIIAALTGQSVEEAAAELQGQGYGKLKDRVSECVIETLTPLQSEHRRLMADKAYLQGVLKENAEIANRMALRTLRKVQRKIGFAERLK